MSIKEKLDEKNKKYRFTIKQMGNYWGEGSLELSDDFVKKNLNLFKLKNKLTSYSGKRSISKIFCPCCKTGFLELIKAKPKFCSTHGYETSWNFVLRCSEECYKEDITKYLYISYSYRTFYC